MIVYVAIGNSDDKLSQRHWADFCALVDLYLRLCTSTFHGRWYSLPQSQYQNACWSVEIDPSHHDRCKRLLRSRAKQYGQDSIAWAEAPITEFLSA